MNKWNGIGRLTSKPELRYTNSNIGYSRFTIAINRPKQKDKEQETDFIDCVAWRGQAENLCNYQDKGNLIAVEGSLRKESYQDKDGNNRSFTSVLVDRIEFLESKKQENKTIDTSNVDLHNYPKEESDPFADFGEQVSIDDNFLD